MITFKIISSAALSLANPNPPIPPPFPQPPPPPAPLTYIIFFFLVIVYRSIATVGIWLSFAIFEIRLSAANCFNFSFFTRELSLLLFFIHIWRISHLWKLCDIKIASLRNSTGSKGRRRIAFVSWIFKWPVNTGVMLDIPSQYMRYCLVPLCEVYCVIV